MLTFFFLFFLSFFSFFLERDWQGSRFKAFWSLCRFWSYVDYLRKEFNSNPLGSLCTPVKRHTVGPLMILCYCGAWILHRQQYSLPQWYWPEVCNQPWAASLGSKTRGWMKFSLKPPWALSLSTFPIASVAHHPAFIIYSLIHLWFGYAPRLAAGARAGSKRDKVPFLMELMF